jgi:hypothetical protein
VCGSNNTATALSSIPSTIRQKTPQLSGWPRGQFWSEPGSLSVTDQHIPDGIYLARKWFAVFFQHPFGEHMPQRGLSKMKRPAPEEL